MGVLGIRRGGGGSMGGETDEDELRVRRDPSEGEGEVINGRGWATVLRQSVLFRWRSRSLLLAVLIVALCCGLDGRLGVGSGVRLMTLAEGRPLVSRSLSGGTVLGERFLQATLPRATCVTILNSSIITSCSPVVEHLPPSVLFAGLPDDAACQFAIRNLVLRPDGSEVYYVATDACNKGTNPFAPDIVSVQSILKASLGSSSMGSVALPTQQSEAGEEFLVSYMWPTSSPSGAPPRVPTVANATQGQAMAHAYTAALSDDGRSLIVGASPDPVTETSWIVSLDVETGVRSSIPISAATIYGLAFNPNHTELYIADTEEPPRLLLAHVNGSSPLPPSFNASLFLTLHPGNFSTPKFGPYSMAANGTCMYLMDVRLGQVWALDTASRQLTLIVGKEAPIAAQFEDTLGELVTTSDGRSVFFTSLGGTLHLLTLDSACGTPLSYQIVARMVDNYLVGLAISPDVEYLYVGTGDGHILRLGLGELP
ncbi:hypothetical protein CBR_g55292 [Chara braunii]|uniref:Uncharacterized protein n=1 Tax=Chara braunii TaxID=69332 RepID=A0A388MD14_CHABU|nr:hypothetical protein CBR_g55292 [Chara braunii]|eukprot:GBG92385.1 hypothetical protein CBR_g55292 [Chara braunii]